jgi:ABC-type phosphate transport system ATPase subunit
MSWARTFTTPRSNWCRCASRWGWFFSARIRYPFRSATTSSSVTGLHAKGGGDVHQGTPDEIVEQSLRQVLLWDKVKDQLKRKATELSLEEQQKLCIARLLPVKPKMLLMDEPCSALDPKGTEAVEELLWELRGQYTILIVTHNMAQARRASEECVFMLMGKVVEHSRTDELFVTPAHKETADYIEGRYG